MARKLFCMARSFHSLTVGPVEVRPFLRRMMKLQSSSCAREAGSGYTDGPPSETVKTGSNEHTWIAHVRGFPLQLDAGRHRFEPQRLVSRASQPPSSLFPSESTEFPDHHSRSRASNRRFDRWAKRRKKFSPSSHGGDFTKCDRLERMKKKTIENQKVRTQAREKFDTKHVALSEVATGSSKGNSERCEHDLS